MTTHAAYANVRPRDVVMALIATEERQHIELLFQLQEAANNPSLPSSAGDLCLVDEHIAALKLELETAPVSKHPVVGVTYHPGPHIVPVSDGLHRTVTRVETRPGLDVFVVYFVTADGEGYQSGNLWLQWIKDTDAKPIAIFNPENV